MKNMNANTFKLMSEIKRDSEVQEELQKCRDDLKKSTGND